MDHYKTLGIERNSTPEQIKQAYRKLASIHHPDKGGDTAKFQDIQVAYETLSDPDKKQEYDHPHQQGFGGFPGGFSFHHGGMNVEDIFGQMFGHTFQQRTHPQQKQHPIYKTVITITLEQAFAGGEQVLQFQTHAGNQIIRVDIPKGVENGQQLRYDKLIPDTVLIVEYRVQDHPKFQRRGLHLYTEIDISVLDLIAGTVLEFEAISGKKFNVTVPKKTQPNSNLRIHGQGLIGQHNQTGDQFLLLKPFIPDIIDDSILQSILKTRTN
jgi:DnaJ-class molecular chaperone